MAEIDLKWYVLLSIGGKEGKVKEYIEAAQKANPLWAELVNQVLVPMEKTMTVRNGKRVVKERVKLPRYVLVEANLTRECAGMLRNVPNVLGFLTSQGKPSPVSQSEVNRLMGEITDVQSMEEAEETFLIGEKVKVIDGSFTGFNGEVKEVYSEKKKLKVIITIFERETPLELSYHQVAKE